MWLNCCRSFGTHGDGRRRLNQLNIPGEGWKQDRQIPSSWEFSKPIQPEAGGRIRAAR